MLVVFSALSIIGAYVFNPDVFLFSIPESHDRASDHRDGGDLGYRPGGGQGPV